jgi:hypothetical protein
MSCNVVKPITVVTRDNNKEHSNFLSIEYSQYFRLRFEEDTELKR